MPAKGLRVLWDLGSWGLTALGSYRTQAARKHNADSSRALCRQLAIKIGRRQFDSIRQTVREHNAGSMPAKRRQLTGVMRTVRQQFCPQKRMQTVRVSCGAAMTRLH
eukprot:5126632-Amphidinium_carterae.1